MATKTSSQATLSYKGHADGVQSNNVSFLSLAGIDISRMEQQYHLKLDVYRPQRKYMTFNEYL